MHMHTLQTLRRGQSCLSKPWNGLVANKRLQIVAGALLPRGVQRAVAIERVGVVHHLVAHGQKVVAVLQVKSLGHIRCTLLAHGPHVIDHFAEEPGPVSSLLLECGDKSGIVALVGDEITTPALGLRIKAVRIAPGKQTGARGAALGAGGKGPRELHPFCLEALCKVRHDLRGAKQAVHVVENQEDDVWQLRRSC